MNIKRILSKIILGVGLFIEILILQWFVGGIFVEAFSGVGYLYPLWFISLFVIQIYLYKKEKEWKYVLLLFIVSFMGWAYYVLSNISFIPA